MQRSDEKKIGYYIRRAREDQEITREDLAAKLSVSLSYIYRVEGGYGGYSLTTLKKFAQALNKPISYFYQWEDQPNDVNKIKDSEVSWRERESTEADNLKLLIEKMITVLEKQGIEIPEKLGQVSDENYMLELVTLLPTDLQKRIQEKILSETWKKIEA